MAFYQTPAKASGRKSPRPQTQDKPSDWICLLCNNLNFSFRKNCNRCKTQTRSQNQNQLLSAYSEYSSYYYTVDSSSKVPFADLTNCHTPQPEAPPQLSGCKGAVCTGSTGDRVVGYGLSFMEGGECWDGVDLVEWTGADTGEKEEQGACEFRDEDLETLINKVLLDEQS